MKTSHRASALQLLTAAGCLLFASASVGETLSDPTQPPQTRNASMKHEFALRLEAVLADDAGRRAIVDGKLVRIGDRIDGATITNITDDCVHYTVEGRERVAQLNREHIVIKRPSSSERDLP